MLTITINSSELSNKVQTISKIQDNKPVLPVLENIRFKCSDNVVSIEAAGTDCSARTSIPVVDGADCTFGVASALLVDILKSIPSQPITLEIENNNCTVRHARGCMTVPVADISDWPTTFTVEHTQTLTLSSASLKNIVQKCSPFVEDDEFKPTLCTICLRYGSTDGKLEAVGTDGHSLLKLVYDCTSTVDGVHTILVHRRFAKSLENMLSSATGDVDIHFDGRNVQVEMSGFDFTFRQVEGKFPNYNSVIPTNYTDSLVVNRKEFLQTLDYVRPCTNQTTMVVAVETGTDEITLQGIDTDMGRNAYASMTASVSGSHVVAGLKDLYLTLIFKSITTDEVRVSYRSAQHAWVFQPVSADADNDMTIILMPMLV